MIAVSIYVKGGVAWVIGSSEPVAVRLEDADNGETVYYKSDGLEVYEIIDGGDCVRVDEALQVCDVEE